MGARILTLEEYSVVRRRYGYVHAKLDWTESGYGFETNGRTYEMPVVQRMLDITSGFVAIGNDLHSLEKEEQRGDKHNLVTVIANEQHCTREQGLAETIRLIDSWCAEFVQLERQLDEACTV